MGKIAKICVIIALLAFSSICFADISDDFESYGTGEIDGQGNWSEYSASTNIFLVTDAVAHGGSTNSLFTDTDGATHQIYLDFGHEAVRVDVTFFIYFVDAAGNCPRFGIADDSSGLATHQGPHLRVNGNDIQNYDGSSWQDITVGNVISDTTWYKIRIIADVSAAKFEIYLDDVKQGTTHDFRVSVSYLSHFYSDTGGSTSGDDSYIDDVEITLGPISPNMGDMQPGGRPKGIAKGIFR